MWTHLKLLVLFFLVVTIAGCSGEAGFSTSDSSATTSTTASSITLLTSSPQLGSSGTTPVSITAIVKDSGNLAMQDIPVVFSADSGTLTITQSVTDTSGIASATLLPGGDYTNRTITITATTGSISQSTTVNVTGTSIAISGETTATLGDNTALTIVLTDSDGDPISGKTVTVTSANGNTITAASLDTNSNGQVMVTIGATVAGTDTITVSAEGASSTHSLTVSGDQFQITTPTADQEIDLGVVQTITARWRVSGTPQVGKTINFTSTRGTLSASSAVTDASGDASVTISSNNAGPALITAYVSSGASTPSTSKSIEFVAITANSIDLQAFPSSIGPNDGSQATQQQSTITATVRDSSNNLVKGKVIRFSITQDNSGGSLSTATSTTNSLGKASTTYISSASTTAKDGVIIRAEVQDTPAVNTTVSLTVAQSDLFVILGTGISIFENNPDNTQYIKPYTVLVTDAIGNAVANASVNISIIPVTYYKGSWVDIAGAWGWAPTASCDNEDINVNGINDTGEDTNGNGRLDPGNIVSVPSSVTTGADGSADFNLTYAQEYGSWVKLDLTATASVSGTEASHTVPLILPVPAALLENSTTAIPFEFSPFGQAGVCTDPN
jgi:Bacterial Ig-like domain (group 1)